MLSLRMSKVVSGLPIRVAQLASTLNLGSPISLRALITSNGTRTQRPRVCVLRYQWETPKRDRAFAPIWPDAFMYEVFSGHNGWSLRDFWYRNTAGLIEIDFQIQPWAVLVGKDQSAKETSDRGKVLQMCKDQASADGVSLDGFDHVIAFLYPGNNNSGAIGGGAVLDQSPFSLEFYQHELGHVLGYQHAFGPQGDYVYEDPWCLMGWSRVQEYPLAVSAALARVRVDSPETFWHGGRRLSAAALFRGYDARTEYASTSSVANLDLARGAQTVDLVAVSESWLYDRSLAVVRGDNFQLTVEYRMPTGDDRGIRSKEDVRSAIIVHSIGRRPVLRWHGDRDPVWLESVIEAKAKADSWITHGWDSDPKDIHVEVVSVQGVSATVRVTRASVP
jgi:hypothetical protein